MTIDVSPSSQPSDEPASGQLRTALAEARERGPLSADTIRTVRIYARQARDRGVHPEEFVVAFKTSLAAARGPALDPDATRVARRLVELAIDAFYRDD